MTPIRTPQDQTKLDPPGFVLLEAPGWVTREIVVLEYSESSNSCLDVIVTCHNSLVHTSVVQRAKMFAQWSGHEEAEDSAGPAGSAAHELARLASQQCDARRLPLFVGQRRRGAADNAQLQRNLCAKIAFSVVRAAVHGFLWRVSCESLCASEDKRAFGDVFLSQADENTESAFPVRLLLPTCFRRANQGRGVLLCNLFLKKYFMRIFFPSFHPAPLEQNPDPFLQHVQGPGKHNRKCIFLSRNK